MATLQELTSQAADLYDALVGPRHGNVSTQYSSEGDTGELVRLFDPVTVWGAAVRHVLLVDKCPGLTVVDHGSMRSQYQALAVFVVQPRLGVRAHSPAMRRSRDDAHLVFAGVYQRPRGLRGAKPRRLPPTGFTGWTDPHTHSGFRAFWDAAPELRHFAIEVGMTKGGSARGRQKPTVQCGECKLSFYGHTAVDCILSFTDHCCNMPSAIEPLHAWIREKRSDGLVPLDTPPETPPETPPPSAAAAAGATGSAAETPPPSAAGATGATGAAAAHEAAKRPERTYKRKKTPSTRTRYKETTYASRLEAKWAYVMDRLAIRVAYEANMVTSQEMNRLLAEVPGKGERRYYKPDFHMPDAYPPTAIEVKPNAPSLQERRICEEYARSHGPIVLLYGGGSRSKHDGAFRYPIDEVRDLEASGVPCVPHAILFTRDATRPSAVRSEAVYFGRTEGGDWSFLPVADVDATLSDADRAFLRQVHVDASRINFHPT
jgi:hypothetical protein